MVMYILCHFILKVYNLIFFYFAWLTVKRLTQVSQMTLEFDILSTIESIKDDLGPKFLLNTFLIMIWPGTYSDQGVEYDSLNENETQRLICLNT